MLKLLYGVALASIVLSTPALADKVESPLVGVWKVVGWQGRSPDGKVVRFFGEHPGGYYSFSPNGHFVFIIIGDERAAAAGFPTTQAEAAKLYATLSAFDGTYRTEGSDRFVVHVEESWNQAWTGTDQSRVFKIDGDSLTVSFTTKDPRTNEEMVVTTDSKRVE